MQKIIWHVLNQPLEQIHWTNPWISCWKTLARKPGSLWRRWPAASVCVWVLSRWSVRWFWGTRSRCSPWSSCWVPGLLKDHDGQGGPPSYGNEILGKMMLHQFLFSAFWRKMFICFGDWLWNWGHEDMMNHGCKSLFRGRIHESQGKSPNCATLECFKRLVTLFIQFSWVFPQFWVHRPLHAIVFEVLESSHIFSAFTWLCWHFWRVDGLTDLNLIFCEIICLGTERAAQITVVDYCWFVEL